MRELRAQRDGEDTQIPTAAEAPPPLVGWVGAVLANCELRVGLRPLGNAQGNHSQGGYDHGQKALPTAGRGARSGLSHLSLEWNFQGTCPTWANSDQRNFSISRHREARGKGGRGTQSSEAQAEVERPGSGPEAETTPDMGPQATEQQRGCLVPAEQPPFIH